LPIHDESKKADSTIAAAYCRRGLVSMPDLHGLVQALKEAEVLRR
jgi:hypothetical protein